MSDKRTITIEVDGDISLRVSDVLCWLRGYRAGKGEDADDDMFFEPIIRALGDLNLELKSAGCCDERKQTSTERLYQ